MHYFIGILLAVSIAAASAYTPCVCTRDRKPVCGTDGKTYANACLFNCAKERSADENMHILRPGPCEPVQVVDQPDSCICTFEYSPVCGSDGTTYSNACGLNCAQRNNPDLTLKHAGVCENVDVNNPAVCICPFNYAPVCGTDGSVYSNECAFNCAKKRNPSLEIRNRGNCEDNNAHIRVVKGVQVADLPKKESCVCPFNYAPVCGVDRKTYSNECLMQCAGVALARRGKCESVLIGTPSIPVCTCTRDSNKVCGTDGQTYSNECLLNCAQKQQGNNLQVAHPGPCEDIQNANIPNIYPCTCTRNLNPVCGTDGVTYNNDCLLQCAMNSNHDLKMDYPGICGSLVGTGFKY